MLYEKSLLMLEEIRLKNIPLSQVPKALYCEEFCLELAKFRSIYAIPEEYRTHNVLKVLLSRNGLTLGSVTRERPASEYQELVHIAVNSEPSALRYVDAAFIDYELLEFCFSREGAIIKEFQVYHHDLFESMVDEHLAGLAISNDIRAATRSTRPGGIDLPERLINDLDLMRGIRNEPMFAGIIMGGLDREYLIKDVVESGFWPEEMWIEDKPQSLAEAVKLYMNDKSEFAQPWYQAAIQTYPVADVAKMMKTKSRLPHLHKMFSRDELSPFVTNTSIVRRQWVEQDLGI